jgi:hypothetical protein
MAPWLITTLLSDGQLVDVVQPGALADPHLVADAELPRELDVDARMDHHAAAHPGTEKAKQPGLG